MPAVSGDVYASQCHNYTVARESCSLCFLIPATVSSYTLFFFLHCSLSFSLPPTLPPSLLQTLYLSSALSAAVCLSHALLQSSPLSILCLFECRDEIVPSSVHSFLTAPLPSFSYSLCSHAPALPCLCCSLCFAIPGLSIAVCP